MDFEQILYEKNGPVLTITLNRPDKLNAYTALMQAEIIQALDAADADDDVRAIIFTGAGRGFCAGADLSGGGNTFNNDAPGRDGGLKRDGGGVLTLRIFESLKPIISAVTVPLWVLAPPCNVQWMSGLPLKMPATVSYFRSAPLCQKPAPAGSYLRSSGSNKLWNGPFPVGSSMLRKLCTAAWSEVSTSRQICCPQPLISRTNSRSQRHRSLSL